VALASAPVGRVNNEPVETRYGFHVVIVDQHIVGKRLPFEAVKPQIAAWLSSRAEATAIRQYIAMLVNRAVITGIDMTTGAAAQATLEAAHAAR
jgi:peptidyl-prolyl cis-trans isomerase C